MNNPSTHHMLRPLFMLCLMTFGCQRESILTTAPPALSIIPAVDLPQQHFGTDRNPQNRQDSTRQQLWSHNEPTGRLELLAGIPAARMMTLSMFE